MSTDARRPASRAPRWALLAPLALWTAAVLALPLMPSQDGGAHLASSVALLAWLRGDALARALLEPTPGFLSSWLWTNWGADALLTAGLALGLSPRWAEHLLLVVLGASWIVGFGAVARRLASARVDANEAHEANEAVGGVHVAPWLALPFLLSKLSFLGFWSFLLACGLGLLAIGLRPAPGGRSAGIAWHVCLVSAIVCHPLGGLLALGVLAVEDVLATRETLAVDGSARSPRRLLLLAPHALFWSLATLGGLRGDGAGQIPAPEAPDWTASILDVRPGWTAGDVPRIALALVVGIWLALWIVGLVRHRSTQKASASTDRSSASPSLSVPHSPPLGPPLRTALLVAALATVAAASLGPDQLAGGTFLRPRVALLGWVALVLALPRVDSVARGARHVPALAATCALLLASASWSHAARQGRAQASWLDALPERAPGPVVVSSFGGLWREGSLRDRFGLLDAHLGSRWAARVGVLDLGNYQLHAGHFPLRARRPLAVDTLDALQWLPHVAPWHDLAGMVDGAILVDLSPHVDATLGCRLGSAWRISWRTSAEPTPTEPTPTELTPTDHTIGAVLLEPATPRALAVPAVDLTQLRPDPLPSPLQVRTAGLVSAPSHACRRWRALVVQPDGLARIPPPGTVEPTEGVFDRHGTTYLDLVRPPPGTVAVLQVIE